MRFFKCEMLNCISKIIPHRHRSSSYLAPMVFLFPFSHNFIMFFSFKAYKTPLQRRGKNNNYHSSRVEKKEEVISTSELIRDRKIAIILVLIKFHYFLDHHEMIFARIAFPCRIY